MGRTLAAERALYLQFARRDHAAGPGKVIAADTQMLIDGYTRSASTFAVVAFQLAQPSPIRVARHLHAPAHLIAAANRHLANITCVRPPEATVLSQAIRENVSIPLAIWSYARFYERIYPYRDSLLIATFDEVTNDFGAVTERVNKRFNTNFAIFDHTDENVQRCFDFIDYRTRRPSWKKVLADYQSGLISTQELNTALAAHAKKDEAIAPDEHLVARPSHARNEMKVAMKDHYRSGETAALRARAERAYDRFIGLEATDSGSLSLLDDQGDRRLGARDSRHESQWSQRRAPWTRVRNGFAQRGSGRSRFQ
ncbi:MAG: hypothetical protein QOG21_464 [Actinomycetota bacterium]|nr:hypothetical protein [Actinomycetota bacterium]